MLVVLCVDLDDDLGRKTGNDTPILGRDAVEAAAVDLATADPEDSDTNVLFAGLNIYDDLDEPAEIAAVTGVSGDDVSAARRVGVEVDTVLERLDATAPRFLVVTDGAQDESVIPVIRSRAPIDGIRRVVVRQAQNLESAYYTIKQVLDDPETRGTILVPLGVLLLIYPLAVIATAVGLPGAVLGVTSALFGLYALFRGLGLEDRLEDAVEAVRDSFYSGHVTLVTYVVALVLLVVGAAEGFAFLGELSADGAVGPVTALAAVTFGAVRWIAAAGVTTSLGRITDEYLSSRFRWRYLNAPFYVISIAAALHAVSGFFVGRIALTDLAGLLTVGTLLGVMSTLTFAVVESWWASAHA